MTDLTWIGGGNNNASNAKDWSPKQVPATGDDLTMNSGIMNISGKTLAGITSDLDVGGNAVINLNNATLSEIGVFGTPNSNGVDTSISATINMSGSNNVGVRVGYYHSGSPENATVNVKGTLTGSVIVADGSSLTMQGGTWNNNNTVSAIGAQGGTATIDSNVVGTGTISLGISHGGNASLTFMKSVGAGQTVNFTSGIDGSESLIIDDPTDFHASINYEPLTYTVDNAGVPIVQLNDLKGVASYAYSLKKDMFTFYGSKGNVIDTLKFSSPYSGFAVEKTSPSTISIYATESTFQSS